MKKILAREELLKLPIGTVIAIKGSSQCHLYGTISGLEVPSRLKRKNTLITREYYLSKIYEEIKA